MNLHTWTGWGGISHWNAFVANLEMHGKGTFYDPRLDDAERFPIAAASGFGHVRAEEDQITPLLGAAADLSARAAGPAGAARQLRPRPPRRAAKRCSTTRRSAPRATCRRSSPSRAGTCTRRRRSASTTSRRSARRIERYRTAPLRGLWTHTKGGFYHDGRFPTLASVIAHYDSVFSLGLSTRERSDLEHYLRSL